MSYIRQFDRQIVTIQGEDPASVALPAIRCKLVVDFKSGNARGSHDVVIEAEQPSGVRQGRVTYPILLEGEDRGARIVLDMNLALESEGLYWFNVYIDAQPVTRVPLRVVHRRVSVSSGPATE